MNCAVIVNGALRGFLSYKNVVKLAVVVFGAFSVEMVSNIAAFSELCFRCDWRLKC